MATPRIGVQGLGLSAPGNLTSSTRKLGPGKTWLIPAGQYQVTPGPYSMVQFLDPVTQTWRNYPAWSNKSVQVNSDGVNFRMANFSGCAIGAVVTNAGTGYTSSPTITVTTGGSSWRAVIGGLVSATQTITTSAGSSGQNYTYPPNCVISAPPPGGVQATATCSISAGAIGTIIITDQGAGYLAAPTIFFEADARDPNNTQNFFYNSSTATPIIPAGTLGTTAGGYLYGFQSLGLTGSATVGAVICTDPGNPLTGLPTLTISGGGGGTAVAVPLMNWSVTSITATGGTTYVGSVGALVFGGATAATATYTNPAVQTGMTTARSAIAQITVASGTIGTSTMQDFGIGFQGTPAVSALYTTPPATSGTLTPVLGGVTDTFYIQPL